MDDDDDWQEMPVVREASLPSSPSSSDEDGSSGQARRKGFRRTNHSYRRDALNTTPKSTVGKRNTLTNATGTHLDIDDARGYSWRAKPKGLGEAGGISSTSEPKTDKSKAKPKRQKAKGRLSGSSTNNSSSESDDEEDDEGGARGYTQLRLDDDPDVEQISAASEYLFSGGNSQAALEDGEAHNPTPHSQLNTTKNLLSEGQKIAYVGLVSLLARAMIRQLQRVPGKDLQPAIHSAEEWRTRVMARMFQHMEIEDGEQRMIESLAQHGVLPVDLAPSLITTQTVDNPDFDPEAEREREEQREREVQEEAEQRLRSGTESSAEGEAIDGGQPSQEKVIIGQSIESPHSSPRAEDKETIVGVEDLGDIAGGGDLGESEASPSNEIKRNQEAKGASKALEMRNSTGEEEEGDIAAELDTPTLEHKAPILDGKPILADANTAVRLETNEETKVTPMGLTNAPQTINTLPSALEGVTTELSSADKSITLDLRWTVLCDLFLVLTADSVYDARSRVLLERVAEELGLHWMDVTKFEKRVTDALEIEEGVSGSLKGKKAVRRRAEAARKRRMVMMGLATVGGGLVIGLSAGLMAPLIGAGLGAALGTIGIGGTTSFLGGVGGAAIITTTGTVGGAALGGSGMNKRTRTVRTFEFKPIHNNKRVNCIVTVPGFMNGPLDDPRLPFSVIDSIMGDVFSVLWEPDMMQEMGNAMYILWNETLVQGVQQVLAATIAGGLVGALAWPLWLTKLGYFIDNPWSNALDRAYSCGLILADVLSKRKLGVRPITLTGFSLGARAIFYALVELARQKKYGIVQNVYLMGAPITASDKIWKEARSVVSGRFVNAFSRTDWILGYLFRATTGGLRSIAGLHPVERVPEVENVDVTQTVPGHLQYRAYVPLVLDELGFRTTADYFDEPEDLNAIPEREVRYDEGSRMENGDPRPKGFAKLWSRRQEKETSNGSTPSAPSKPLQAADEYDEDVDLPPRQEATHPSSVSVQESRAEDPSQVPATDEADAATASAPVDEEMDEMQKILAELRENGIEVKELESSLPPLPLQAAKAPQQETILDPQTTTSSVLEVPTTTLSKTAAIGVKPEPDQSSSPLSSSRRGSEMSASSSSGQNSIDSLSGKSSSRPGYARKFGSASFDADELPTAVPVPISDHGEVSLSFADSYDEEGESGFAAAEAPSTVVEQVPVESLQSAKQYGLSDETAQELARQFRSSGMSTQGASAAAKLAQNFSEMGQGSTRVSPTTTRRPSLDLDPWGSQSTLAVPLEPPQSFSMGRTKTDDDSAFSPSARTPTAGSGGWTTDNPWG